MKNDKLTKKLNKIKALADECLVSLSETSGAKFKKAVKKISKKNVDSEDYIVEIVNKIKNCDESDVIEKEILDKNSEAGRILLPFYISGKYLPGQELTTKDIEKITIELGKKIRYQNVSNAITKKLNKYLLGSSTRKPGKGVSYKLNQKGVKYFESLLNPNEKQ